MFKLSYKKCRNVILLMGGILISSFINLETSQAASNQYCSSFTKLPSQPYALCAGVQAWIFDKIVYAKCNKKNGTSISLNHQYTNPSKGNIQTVNTAGTTAGDYIVSTYSAPTQALKNNSGLAIYTCQGGAYAQCDGGLCFSNTSGKKFPGWNTDVKQDEIICSCPITSTSETYQVMGPGACPTTAAAYDKVCATGISDTQEGQYLYIGSPGIGQFENLAACLQNQVAPVPMNNCTRPSR